MGGADRLRAVSVTEGKQHEIRKEFLFVSPSWTNKCILSLLPSSQSPLGIALDQDCVHGTASLVFGDQSSCKNLPRGGPLKYCPMNLKAKTK